MPLDSYSPCPGGRDKKIKFCCPDLLKELQQLESLMQAGQTAAAFSLIEKLEKDHPDCACLKTAKCRLLRMTDRWGEFLAVARGFAESEPDNIQAISEYILGLSAAGESSEALSLLIDGIEMTEPGKLSQSLILPILMLGTRLAEEGNLFPAVALTKLCQAYDPKSPDAAELLRQIYSRREIPLELKEMSFDRTCPENYPGKKEYADAVLRMATGQWKKARAILETLADRFDEWPNLFRSLALVRFWLGENLGGLDALRTFAAAKGISDDDAVDAEKVLLLLKEDSGDDSIEVFHLVYPITDEDAALEKFLSSPEMANMPFDPRQYGSADRPAPNHIFRILDKPYPADDAVPSLENTPILLGTLLLFGRQTDRTARIEIQALATQRPTIIERLKKTLGDLFGPEESCEPLARFTWTMSELERDFQFKPTTRATREQILALYESHLVNSFTPKWLNHSSSDFGGKTPLEAAADSGNRHRIAAAIEVLALQAAPEMSDRLAETLREKLGIPEPKLIPLPENCRDDNDAAIDFFTMLPIWRWSRVELTNLSSSAAGRLLSIVRLFGEEKSIERFAARVLDGPALRQDLAARFAAYEALIEKASIENHPERAIELIERGTAEAKEFNVPDSRFNLREAMLRIASGDAVGFQRIVEHIAREHRDEPETMESLQMLLVNLGILNPDGTPRQMPMPGGAAPGAPRGNGLDAASSEPPKSSGLWTPGSDEGTGGGGGGKLWTPE